MILLSHTQNKPLWCLRASQEQESCQGVKGVLYNKKKPSKKSNQLITRKGGEVLTLALPREIQKNGSQSVTPAVDKK